MEEPGDSISNFPRPLASSSQLHPQMDVTILRGENLPRLKTWLGSKREYYVTVTNGVITKKTVARRSASQAVQWNEKLSEFDIHPSSHVDLSLYAKKMIGADILVGRQRVPLKSQNDAALSLENSDGSGGSSNQPTLYLTVVVPAELSSSPRQSDATTQDPGKTTQPVAFQSDLPQIDDHPVDPSSPSPQRAGADAHTEMSPENILASAEEAVVEINISDALKSAVSNIQWVMDAVSSVAELHPYAQMAWSLLSKIPEPFLQQFQRDENVRLLLDAIRDGFSFAQEAEMLRNIKPNSKQAHILTLMLQHVCNCGDFIQTYAKDTKFRKRFIKNISGKADEQISNYRTTLDKLRHDFLDHAAITTEVNTYQILDDVGIISTNVKGISAQLEWVSTTVSDMDLDTKISEIPYKTGWRSDVKRSFLPGTRVEFLDYIVDWVNNPDAARGLVLFGQAGTGKSSIAHEIAHRFRDMNRLSSYFVFLRKEQSRRKDYLLFPTLVHDLASRYPSFKTALGAAIRNNKSLRAAEDYHTLFEDLLLQPLRDLHIVGPIVVVIDALDESGDASGEDGLHTFLAASISKLPSQFRILITSRREKDIDLTFTAASSVRIIEMTDRVLAATTNEDIRAYLRESLPRSVFERYGNDLETKAEGLFQWAAVACGYIRRPPPGYTVNRCIKGLLDPSSNVAGLELLDKLYKDILEGYFKSAEVRPLFRSIMGQLFAAFEPLSITSLSSLRQHASHSERDDEDSVTAIVSHLGSLLSNVTPPDSLLPIAPLHTSFRDFLTDQRKSGEFYVDLKIAHHDLADYCLGLMLDNLKFNICELESSYLTNKDVPDIDDRIQTHIPKALSYACGFWDDHIERLDFDAGLFDQLQALFNNKFLFWLEVLSLTGDVALAPPALLALKTWLAPGDQPSRNTVEEFKQFIEDASTFVRYFAMPIAKSAPHIYISCLPFAPISSHIFKRYSPGFPRTLSLQDGQLSHWPALEMAIPAHDESVQSVSFSPDGQHIVSGSKDHTLCVWNATTGQMVGEPFTGHDNLVLSVSFSPDGQYIVSGSDDHTIRVWNSRTGKAVGAPFTGHDDTVWSVLFSPDGQHIVSGSEDRTIRVWDAKTGQLVGKPLTGHDDAVWSVSFSPDGQHIVSGSADHTIRVWNAKTGELVGEPLIGHDDSVWCVIFSPDGRRIVSASDDGTVRMWDFTTREMVRQLFAGHDDSVFSVSFSPDGEYIASGSDDCTIRMWNAITGERVGEPFTGHEDSVLSVSFSPDGQYIVSSSDDCTIRMWNARAGGTVGEPSVGHDDSVNSVSFSFDGNYIASGSNDRTLRIWDARTGEMVGKPFSGHKNSVFCVSFSPDGQRIASGSHDRTIRVWDVKTGETVGEPFNGHKESVWCVSFSPDGRYIVSGSEDCTIRVWDAGTGETVGEPFTGHGDPVNSVAFSPDGLHIVSGSDDHTIRMWDSRTGEPVGQPFTGHSSAVSSVSFSPDGQYVASGSDDCTIRMWNAKTGEVVGKPFTGHDESLLWISFSPDGQYIASGSVDCTLRVWNTRTGEMVGQPSTGHNSSVSSVSFSPDGQYIASASYDHTIRLSKNATEAVKTKEIFDITDDSIIDGDGWIYGPEDELFLWVPQLHRSSLYRPSTVWIAGGRGTRLDLSKFVHGRDWSECLGRG